MIIDKTDIPPNDTKPPAVSSKKSRKKRRKRKGRTRPTSETEIIKPVSSQAAYPRHSIDKCLRIPRAIIEQNAGKDCTESEAAGFVGVGMSGDFRLELSSCKKFSLLERPETGRIQPTELAKKIVRPQNPDEELKSLRQSIINAPCISEVYSHYRGENLPDELFFRNALIDKFRIPEDKISEFTDIFIGSLLAGKLIEEREGKKRVLDITEEVLGVSDPEQRRKALGKDVKITSGDTCFVMMPFASPIGDYYSKVYETAIRKAGLVPVRADIEIFATGKIINQIWRGISNAKVLLAELTNRNPNVFYELGLAHAAGKPVVLVSSNQEDVPFDLQHIRVIYYDIHDPFWGNKLIEKVAENILSAIKTPDEAKFERAVSG